MQMVVMQFNQFQTQLQQDIAQSMEQLGQYPMAQRYAQLVSDLATNLMVRIWLSLVTCPHLHTTAVGTHTHISIACTHLQSP